MRKKFLSFWAILLLFLKNQNFQKMKKKKPWRLSSFYTCVPQTTIIWCMVPEIWSNVDKFFFSFWTICSPFTHLTIQKIKILKKWKNSLRYQHFTQVTIIWSSLEIGRNNCFVTALSPSLIKDGNDNLFPQTHLHNTNAFFWRFNW